MTSVLPLLITVVVGCFALAGLHMTLTYLSARDKRRQEKLDEATKAYIDEAIRNLDGNFGKALAHILDDIGQLKTKTNLNQLL